MELTENQLATIRQTLKRCSPETIAAAIQIRACQDLEALPVFVLGVINRYLPPENRAKLTEASNSTRLVEDLGIDSLTMLEIVLTIEESLEIDKVDNAELQTLRTIGDIKNFLAEKASGAVSRNGSGGRLSAKKTYQRDQIICALPQQPPFLFLDRAEIHGNVITASYQITGEEYFLQGHFKDNPVFPASILFEAMGQAGCLWLVESKAEQNGALGECDQILFSSMEDARFHRITRPGDRIDMELKLIRFHAPLAVFSAVAHVGHERVASVESLVLAMASSACVSAASDHAVVEMASASRSV